MPAKAPRQSEPQAPKLVTAVGEPELNRIKAKVQAEVCALISRTILQQFQSSAARAPAKYELLRRQAVNRLYADVLYGLLSGGAAARDETLRTAAVQRVAADNRRASEG